MPMRINQKKISDGVGALVQDLKAKAQRSQQDTKQERKDTREMLPHNCIGFQATWRDCRSLRCKIKASYMLSRCNSQSTIRVWPVSSTTSWYSGCSQYTEESTLPPEAEQYMERNDTSPEDLHSSLRSDRSTLSTPEQVAPIREPNISPLCTAKDLTRICLVVIIVGLIIALIFRICRNTMHVLPSTPSRSSRTARRKTCPTSL